MTTLTDVDAGCNHHGSPRPKWCRCGQHAAFWTLPPGTCDVCRKDTFYHDPSGDGLPSTPWCINCRNQAVTDDGEPA